VVADGSGNWSVDVNAAMGALPEGTYALTARATDVNGNAGVFSGATSITIDTTPPSVVISDDEGGVANIAGGDVTYTFTFDEDVTGFDASDVVVANGTKGAFNAVDPQTYTLVVTPDADFEGNMTVDVAGGAAQDIAGNNSNAAVQSVQAVDTLRPTLNISLDDYALKIGDVAQITFEFSEDVTGFDASDVTVDAALLSNFASVDGNTYTADLTPNALTTDLNNLVTVGTGYADGNGNAPAASTDSANYTVDTVRPEVTSIVVAPTALNATNSATVTVTFSEDVQGFTAGDITSPNANVSNFAGSGSSYTFDIAGAGTIEDATNVINLGTGWTDMADATGNSPTGPTTDSNNYTVDTVIPVPVYQSAVYDAANDLMIITGTDMDTLLSFIGTVENYGDDISANLDFSKLHWDVDGNGSNDFNPTGSDIAAAYVYDANTLHVILAGATAAVVEGAANFGSKSGSAWDSLVIDDGFSVDWSGNVASNDGATLTILGELNQVGMPMVFETNFSSGTDLVNETLGLAGVAAAAFDRTIDSLHVSGGSAADLSVSGTAVAGSALAGAVALLDTASGNSVSLTGFTAASLDGSVITFDDGSVLKTNIGAKATLSGGTGDDLLIAGANGDRLLGNAGDDMLLGGAGNDQIYGGNGADSMFGGAGADYLNGGAGADNFVFAGLAGETDTIADFEDGTDLIVIDSGVAAEVADFTQSDSGNDLLLVSDNTGAVIRLLGHTGTVLTNADFTFSSTFYVDGQDIF
jgi:Ca2+-binding RTX toxin-like protein